MPIQSRRFGFGLIIGLVVSCTPAVAQAAVAQAAAARSLQAVWPDYAQAAQRNELQIDSVPIAGALAQLELRRVQPFARGARFVIVDDQGSHEVDPPQVALFSGIVVGDPSSTAFLSLSPFGTYGFISTAADTIVISSGAFGSGEAVQAASISSLPVPQQPYRCLTSGGPSFVPPPPPAAPRGAPPCRTAIIGIETDYEYMSELFGGNAAAASAYATTLLAASSAIFTRDLNLRLELGYLRVWTTPADPWTALGIDSLWVQFSDYWNTNMRSVHRHLAHFLTSRSENSGIARMGGVCDPVEGYAVSNINGFFPTPVMLNHAGNWDLMVVTHELGHNFGAPHTHEMVPPVDHCGDLFDCSAVPGTVMSYCHICPNGVGDVSMRFHERSMNEAMLPYLETVCDLNGAPFDGHGLWFDGINDYVGVGGLGASLPTTEITIEFWQYVEPGGTHPAFGLNPDDPTNRVHAAVPSSDGRVYWDFGNSQAGGRLSYQPPVPLTGSWQHFAFVVSQSAGKMRIFRNGVMEAEQAGMDPFEAAASGFRIGALGTSSFFRGTLDELRIWSVARSPAEIADNFDQVLDPAQNPALLYYWRFEEGGGTTTSDLVANRAGAINGATWVSLIDCIADSGACCMLDGSCQMLTAAACAAFAGYYRGDGTACGVGPCIAPGACCVPATAGLCTRLFEDACVALGGVFCGPGSTCDDVGAFDGACIDLDGLDDRAILGNPAAMNFAGAITMEAWIRAEATSGIRNVLLHGPGGTRRTGLRLNEGRYEVFSADPTVHGASIPIPFSDDGKWVHLAGVYDGAAWRLYHNGAAAAQSTDATGALVINSNWSIGGRTAIGEFGFAGEIDEVRLWSRARTAEEIAADLARPLTGSEAGLVGCWRLDERAGTAILDSSPLGHNGTLQGGTGWRDTRVCGPTCPPDLDHDGQVGLADLALLLSNFGNLEVPVIHGDLDGDLDVDLADLAALLSSFGGPC